MLSLKIGGKPFTTGGKVEHGFNRYESWSKHGGGYFGTDFTSEELAQMSLEQLTTFLIKEMGVNKIMIEAFKNLHETVVKVYLGIIERWVKKYPDKAKQINFRILDVVRPGNYTPANSKLANIRYDGLDPSGLKGFCRYEPDVRLMQLRNYKIELFLDEDEDITISDEDEWPVKPSTNKIADNDFRRMARQKKLSMDEIARTRIGTLKPVLVEWEKYYTKSAKLVEQVSVDLAQRYLSV